MGSIWPHVKNIVVALKVMMIFI